MAYAHEPIPDASLSPGLRPLVGSAANAALRTMAARGLAPLPPGELLVGLYQCWVLGRGEALSETATQGLLALPQATLLGALGDPKLPAGVLDFVARKLPQQAAVLEAIVRHPAVDDETLCGVARVCPSEICDILADNQRRWLARPAIAEALYYNRACRMSVVHRMIELAEREGVALRIPMLDELKASLRDEGTDPERDQVFAEALAASERELELDQEFDEPTPLADEEPEPAGPEPEPVAEDLPQPEPDGAGSEPESASADDPAQPEPSQASQREGRLQQLMRMRSSEKIRAALLGDAFDRSVLVRDANRVVALAAAKSPKVKETEVVGWSANRSLSHDVIRYVANKREWVKLYTVKLNLVMNPKTPLARAMSLLTFLSAQDVRKVARSKNISSALATAARRKDQSRR